MSDTKQLWESALTEIELSVSKATFTTWFKGTSIARIEDGIVLLSVPNPFVKDWLYNKHHKSILRALRNLSEHIRSLDYIVAKDDTRGKEAAAARVISPVAQELPLRDYYVDKESNLNP